MTWPFWKAQEASQLGKRAESAPRSPRISYWNRVNASASLGWLFPAIGAPILVIAALLTEKMAKDAWILQGIAPAFIVFSVLLGLSLVLGDSRLVEVNAAIALAVLAILPSIKYGFVYGEYDSVAHWATASEIVHTGSLASSSMYAIGYAGIPLLHILLASTALTADIPVETAIVCTLFLEHFVTLVLLVESARRIFPQVDKRIVVLLTVMTAPVLFFLTGTTFGLLAVAMLIYVFSARAGRESKPRDILLTTILMFFLVFSHSVTSVYFLAVLTGYTISLLAMRRFGTLRGAAGESTIKLLHPLLTFLTFLTSYALWLVYLGSYIIDVVIGYDLFAGSSLPPAAGLFSFTDLIRTILFKYGRFWLSILPAVGASSIALLRYRKNLTLAMFLWLLAGSVFIGGVLAVGHDISLIWRFLAYASLTAPYFLCLLISRAGKRVRLLNTSRIGVIKAIMLMGIVLSMVATYPMTPLYPKYGGNPVLDDNSVNSIYVLSGLDFFSSAYSSGNVITTNRIFWQMLSLHPQLMPLAWVKIFRYLENVTTPGELRGELVVFDMGGRSGESPLAMRALAPGLRDTLGVVYSNGYFYIAIAT